MGVCVCYNGNKYVQVEECGEEVSWHRGAVYSTSVFSQLTSTEIYSILEDASNYRLFRVKCMGGTGQAIGHH